MVTFKSNSNCLRCGKNSLLTDEDTGEQFCAKCGYVISEKLQASGPELRSLVCLKFLQCIELNLQQASLALIHDAVTYNILKYLFV